MFARSLFYASVANAMSAEMYTGPGELTLTSNPQTVAFTGVLKDTKRVWLRGYAVNGAPMGAGVPLFPQLVVLFDGSKFRHVSRQTTNTPSAGHPLTLTGANTYQEYNHPRYLGYLHAPGEELRSLEVQVQTPAGATTDGAGNPLFSSLVLDLAFEVEPYERVPQIWMDRKTIMRDTLFPY